MANDRRTPPPSQPGSGAFDPAAGQFLAMEQAPPGLAPVLAAELSPLLRTLLVIDGTVTTFLSAWALEPVVVRPLSQQATALPVAGKAWAGEWLEAAPGTPVLERAVLLAGGRSHGLYAWAESLICTDRLPPALRSGLLDGGLSLGQLLRLPGFESRREGLWYGRERPSTLPPAVAALGAGDFLARTYRVSAGSRPLMLITERFPWGLR